MKVNGEHFSSHIAETLTTLLFESQKGSLFDYFLKLHRLKEKETIDKL